MKTPALAPPATTAPAPGSPVEPGTGQGAPEVALDVRDVRKSYRKIRVFRKKRREGTESMALRDVSFQLRRGETLGLLGPNGAGKTTLLKILTTLIYPTSGRILLFGRDIAEHPRWTRSVLGLVTCDERSFYWRLTGWQNLEFFGTLYGLDKTTLRERGEELLSTLGLLDAADRQYQDYSSGMKQKMAIARGLLAGPRLVFYDEPTRSLDPVSVQSIRTWIKRRKRSAPDQSHIIATNQLSEAEELCDRVLILNQGRIAALGTPAEIRARFHADDAEMHRIVLRPGEHPHRPPIAPDPANGLLDVSVLAPTLEGQPLRVRTLRGSAGLSRALAALLDAGETVMRCDLEEPSFDEVFCSVILGRPGPDEEAA